MLLRLKSAQDLQQVLHVGMHNLMSLLGAERGNIQLVGRNRELVVVAQYGFTPRFLEEFRRVSAASASICGRAAAARELIFVPDIAADAGFAPHLAVARDEGITSVLSCPLTASHDHWIGMVSVHFALRANPTPLELASARTYGEALACAVDRLLPAQDRVEAVEAMAEALLQSSRTPPRVSGR